MAEEREVLNRQRAPEEPILGMRNKDFVQADKVLGADVRIEELPDGIKFYIRNQAINLGNKRIATTLYELHKEDGGLKLRKEPLEKFINKIPEETYVCEAYGPSEEGYIWIAKWVDASGDEKGVMSDTIRCGEKWRARHEAYKRRQLGGPEHSPSAAPVPAPASAALGPLEILNFIQQGEDRAIRNMERMAAVLKSNQPETPSAVWERMHESMGRVMEKMTESSLNMVKKTNKALERSIDPEDGEDGASGEGQGEEMGGTAGSEMPFWLKPIWPMIENGIGGLLGGGPTGAVIKNLVVNSDQWKEIFADPVKFGQFTEAAKNHFGDDVTQKALNILLNKRSEKKAKGK